MLLDDDGDARRVGMSCVMMSKWNREEGFFSILLWKDVSNCWKSDGGSRAASAGCGIMESHNH